MLSLVGLTITIFTLLAFRYVYFLQLPRLCDSLYLPPALRISYFCNPLSGVTVFIKYTSSSPPLFSLLLLLLLIFYCYLLASFPTCRKLRTRDSTKFRVQLCVSLTLLLVVFVGQVVIDYTHIKPQDIPIPCSVLSALTHYFTLTSLLWMGAEAVLMFRKLVLVFGVISKTFYVVTSLVAWGESGKAATVYICVCLD